MRVTPEIDPSELQLYSKKDVAERARIAQSSVDRDSRDPTCPLHAGFKVLRGGRQKVCTAQTLRDYLLWRMGEFVPPAPPAKPKLTRKAKAAIKGMRRAAADCMSLMGEDIASRADDADDYISDLVRAKTGLE